MWRGQAVAVKKLMNQKLGDGQLDFYAEISIHSSLRHPNCVLFLGAVMSPPNISIVTSLKKNGSLHR
jgi:serine/threonine protein kinase